MKYRSGYKYQLVEDYQIETDIPGVSIATPFIVLSRSGLLTIRAGYAWDGASGPTFDSKSSMRGSLVHDALYQLMSIYPDLRQFRLYADELLFIICKQDGMSALRAWLWKKAVNIFGGSAAKKQDQILEAP
jgi:hypothetical protein